MKSFTGCTNPETVCLLKCEFLSSAVYLNVTNIETYNVDHDKFCIKWTPHRAATSYRIKLNPQDRKSFFKTYFPTVPGRHCFHFE